MASSITIANRALTLIGAERITSLDDQSKSARACKGEYDNCRQAELQSTNWSFAITRASLAASATAPVWGFTYAYPYPADAIRIVQVADYFVGLSLTNLRTQDEQEYSLEKRQILSNIGAPLKIRYVADVTDASQFAPLFCDAVSHRLAASICETLTQSTSKKTAIEADYKAIIIEARRCNAVEKAPVNMPDDSWIAARV